MPNPYYISMAVRKNGVLHLEVIGHGLTAAANNGNRITIVGNPVRTVNGVFTILSVINGDTVRIAQPGLPDIDPGVAGGAFALG